MGEVWYLLYQGESCDGRGAAKFVGRTTSLSEACEHMRNVQKSPYRFGHVLRVTNYAADTIHSAEGVLS